jgi:hypothetical protein
MSPAKRDLRIDFFRGMALIFIFIDHVPGNVLTVVTIGSFGFSDAAEVFIFLSGYSAAFIYGRAMRERGFLLAAAQIWNRCWQLYVAHIFLFVVFTAEVAYIAQRFKNPMFAEELNVANFLEEPHVAVVMALLLRFQPTFMDILPLYISLLLVFPFILWMIGRNRWIVLALSIALYCVQWTLNFDVPAYPDGQVWFFNPVAWQLLFVIGALIGHGGEGGGLSIPRGRVWTGLALATAAGCFLIGLSWKLANAWSGFPAILLDQVWPVDKTDLALIRLFNFLAIAHLSAIWIAADQPFLSKALARPIVLCGQHSLYVFCLSIFLCVIGQLVMVQFDYGWAAQAAVNAGGIGTMMVTAWLLSWYKDAERAAAGKARMPVASGASRV